MTGLAKPVTWLFGVIFLVVGLLGFFMNPVLGIFEVNTLHNLVHLASGAVALIAASMGTSAARMYLIVFGLVYVIVTIAGFLGFAPVIDLLQINSADNLLHLAIAAVFLVVGFSSNN